ncbi:MAG: dTMP kinase [Endomicrobiales bacterium]|nr:dTMP kinase [Endomicrobiales bacterium]
MSKKGFFITFEGCEGSGKSTQMSLLVKHLKKTDYLGRIIPTREPGGSNISDAIRKLLLNPEYQVAPLAELFLYESNRAQHINDIIKPALKHGKIVICDRYTDSTLAYQGYARGLDLGVIKTLNKIASSNIKPDLTIYLDLPIKIGLKKARKLGKDLYIDGDRIERENISFHKKVRKGFLDIARKEPSRIKTVKVASDIEKTHRDIVTIVEKALKA